MRERPDFAEVYGIEASPELVRELRQSRPAGIHLMRRNVESPEQVRELTRALLRELGTPLDFAVEHEGGRVTPFVRGVTAFPGLEALEVAAEPVLAREVGRAMGRELFAMGITMNWISGSGPMAGELALGLRSAGIRAGPGPLGSADGEEADDREGEALAASVAGLALRVERDPGTLLPLSRSRRVGLIVPRLGDVADRLPVPLELRSTAAILRPEVGAGVAVLEVSVQADDRAAQLAAEWMADQETGVLFLFDPHRFTGQRRVLEAVSGRCPRLVVVALGTDSDRSLVPASASLVWTHGFQACQLRAALGMIFEPAATRAKRK